MGAAATKSRDAVIIDGVSHRYAREDVLKNVSLRVEHGELMTLLGPSGSGKSTMLRIIGGLERPRSGTVRVGDRDVTHEPPERRDIGIVFQNYALFPHMSVLENVRFPLRMRGIDRSEARARALETLELVELASYWDRKPSELSGGEQQRVALARALVFEPRVLLLDEPFGALDRRLREQLGLEVRRVQRELGVTTIFVTHDHDEAFTISTRIAVMGDGEVFQIDTPTNVYQDPTRLEVARYLGNLNEFGVVAHQNGATMHVEGPGGIQFSTSSVEGVTDGATLRCGIRPEHLQVERAATEMCLAIGTISAAIFGGDWMRAQLVLDDGHELMAVLSRDRRDLSDGDRVWVGIKPEHCMLFDPKSGRRVG